MFLLLEVMIVIWKENKMKLPDTQGEGSGQKSTTRTPDIESIF